MKIQVDKNMKYRKEKLFYEENYNNFYLFHDAFLSENDTYMILLHNHLIQFFSLNRQEVQLLFNYIKDFTQNYPDQLEECIKIQKKFENLYNHFPEIVKPQLDILPILPSFYQKWNDEGKMYIGRKIPQEKKEVGMLLSNQNRIFLGEFIIENFKKVKSGIGSEIKLDQNSLNKKLFFGEFKNNVKNGLGIKYCKNGRYFLGNYKTGKKDGEGFYFSNDRAFIGGIFFQGKLTTQGIKGDGKGMIYKGELKNDLEDGKGELTCPNQYRYKGQFSKGKIEGQGLLEKCNGEKFEGIFHQGTFKQGNCKQITENGDIYEGNFRDGKCNGYGKMIYSNHEIYQGNFVNGQKEGMGKQEYPNNGYYNGEWKNNQFHGHGIRYFSDKCSYEGFFKNNEYNGKGKFVNEEGEIYDGDWIMGRKTGMGVTMFRSGNKY